MNIMIAGGGDIMSGSCYQRGRDGATQCDWADGGAAWHHNTYHHEGTRRWDNQ